MIRVAATSIGKKYKIYPHPWGRLLEWTTADRFTAHTPDWALRDVTFEIHDGESVGVIGMNGAGKSTLLKILTGTTQPTEGSVAVSGGVAALLELGIGIHPEFSGWQNALLTCQLMGLDPAVINGLLPWIQSFSELGAHMDQPVRTYSTGMQLRLAFSAATAVRPDVLIVDEALAVGDAYFQHKSINRIRAFKEQGTTLLFVTHDPAALKALCERAILLDRGHLLHDGPAEAVFNYYNALIAQKERAAAIMHVDGTDGRMVTRSGNKEAEIVAVELCDSTGQARQLFQVGETATLRCQLRINHPMSLPTVGFLIRDRLGGDVFGTNTFHLAVEPRHCAPGQTLAATFEIDLNIGPGHYSVTAAIHRGRAHVEGNYDWWDQAVLFQVVPNQSFAFDGVAALPTRWVEPTR